MIFLSYMAPCSLPHSLYHCLSELLVQRLEESVDLWFCETASGPDLGQLDNHLDPYSEGRADIGIQCAPTYVWAHDRPDPKVELIGWAPIYHDPRIKGEAIYYSDVTVAANRPFTCFEDLRGGSWAYNDPQSLSGYYSVLNQLEVLKENRAFFSRTVCSGAHRNSIQMLLSGEIDSAAIDSNVLLCLFHQRPELVSQLKVIDQLGPYGVQPLVMSTRLAEERKSKIRQAFQDIAQDQAVLEHLSKDYLVAGLVPVKDSHYDRERDILRRCTAIRL